jgi:hypothetical protein
MNSARIVENKPSQVGEGDNALSLQIFQAFRILSYTLAP